MAKTPAMMPQMPATGMHSIVIQSSLEIADGTPVSARTAKPVTLFQPRAQPPPQHLPTTRPHRQEEEDSDIMQTQQPPRLRQSGEDVQFKSGGNGAQSDQNEAGPRILESKPTLQGFQIDLKQAEQGPGTSPAQPPRADSLVLLPNAMPSIVRPSDIAIARVASEQGSRSGASLPLPSSSASSQARTGDNVVDVPAESGSQNSMQRRMEIALQALKEERKEREMAVALLKKREAEITSLHQLLWHSTVSPDGDQQSQLILKFLNQETALSAASIPAASAEGDEGDINAARAKVLALELQIMQRDKTIQEQDLQLAARKSPLELEVEELRLLLQHKDDVIEKIDKQLQDLTIARKADIELKTKELLEMQGLLAVKDRCIDMLCEKVESARALSPKLEHHASGIDGTPENREHRPEKSFFVDGDVMGKKRVECVDPSIVPQSSLSCTTVAQPNRVSVGKTVLSVDALAKHESSRPPSGAEAARRREPQPPRLKGDADKTSKTPTDLLSGLDTAPHTPSSSATDRSRLHDSPKPKNMKMTETLSCDDWDSVKAELDEQKRQHKDVAARIDLRKDGVASCRLARLRQDLVPPAIANIQPPKSDEVITM